MHYAEALDYLYSRLPVFHRIGPKALKPGLANTLRLCEALGNPQTEFRSIHVAGTNGKGSTSHMLASIYQSAGYRVGLYTSPHLKTFTERIRLNGQPIAEADVATFVTQHQTLIEAVEPSFFEVTVAMAFAYFARRAVDIAIVETGLGGRLDSTNILTPIASVITNIGLDHTDVLGDTLPLIAREKAGIIKAGVPVIIGETQTETEEIFREVAESLNAPLRFADQQCTVVDKGLSDGIRQVEVTTNGLLPLPFSLDLTGMYQLRNLPVVLTTVETLQNQLPSSLSAQRAGLRVVTSQTGLKGRFQTIREQPRLIADTAHNAPGLVALLEALRSLTYTSLHVVIGLVADKDRHEILALLPTTATYYFCQAQSPRSLPAEMLQAEAKDMNLVGNYFPNVNDAVSAALQQAFPSDLIVVTGSNYVIGELSEL